MKKTNFEPDKLALTKQDILDFCDRVLEKWSKNPTQNTNHILAMNAVKTSVIWTDDESLKAIWGEILSWTFDLLYENALAQGNVNDEKWSNTMKKIKNKK
ncbi:MAG: hypothetical protein ACE5RO_04360 [Candidatus Nitrosomaritimum yanchengensis]